MKRLDVFGKNKKATATVYFVLRFLVILTMIFQFIRGNYENVFMCILTLILFLIPIIIERKLNIKLPNTLEIIIFLFIFSAQILGEVQNFYGIFKHWDTILHTLNGFLCGAIGFSMIDILNRSTKFHKMLTPVFVALVAFCFSMTIGVLWEFIEYGMDKTFNTDMQKDRVISTVSSTLLNESGENKEKVIKDIEKTMIYGSVEGEKSVISIDGSYLDIGINDTMKDLIVNFIGAIVFSILGLLYIKNRDEYKFAEEFMPIMKTEEEIEETRKELERLEKVLEEKKNNKQNNKKRENA